MALHSIGEVAERCGINPVTLRVWQRRYGLLKPWRSEGGHRQSDEEDILCMEEIRRWIGRDVSVGKAKALLEGNPPAARDESAHLQEEMMSILRYIQPARIRIKLMAPSHQHPIGTLIDGLLVPVRQRLKLDQNISLMISSLLGGLLIDCVTLFLAEARRKNDKETLLVDWSNENRTRLWLKARHLSQRGWHANVLAEPLESPRPELFPGQHIFIWTERTAMPLQEKLFSHWREQGLSIHFHSTQWPRLGDRPGLLHLTTGESDSRV